MSYERVSSNKKYKVDFPTFYTCTALMSLEISSCHKVRKKYILKQCLSMMKIIVFMWLTAVVPQIYNHRPSFRIT